MLLYIIHGREVMSDDLSQLPAASEPVQVLTPFFYEYFIKLLF